MAWRSMTPESAADIEGNWRTLKASAPHPTGGSLRPPISSQGQDGCRERERETNTRGVENDTERYRQVQPQTDAERDGDETASEAGPERRPDARRRRARFGTGRELLRVSLLTEERLGKRLRKTYREVTRTSVLTPPLVTADFDTDKPAVPCPVSSTKCPRSTSRLVGLRLAAAHDCRQLPRMASEASYLGILMLE